MALAKYESLLPEVAVHAPNCPEPALISAIRNACIEFCNATQILTQDMDAISVVSNEAVYDIDAGAGVDVVKVLQPLYFKGKKLESFSTLGVQAWTDWQAHTAPEPTAFTCFKPNEITLYPKPTADADLALTGRIVLAPSRASISADAGMLSDYRVELAAGALAHILAIPDQPYTNLQLAAVYGHTFASAKANGAITVRSAFMNAPLRVRFPGF
jgi:hypothetical protein